jgi:hypothetical protein
MHDAQGAPPLGCLEEGGEKQKGGEKQNNSTQKHTRHGINSPDAECGGTARA